MHVSPPVDFHCHHIPTRFRQTAADTFPPTQRARWEALARKLSDEALLGAAIDGGDLSARVVNIPAALVADASGHVPHDDIRAMNDCLADLATRRPGRLHALASIDAYDGERAAREVERAVRDLGLRGLFVDCARGDDLIDAPQARPTLEAAARLCVPVFVHPVNPQPLTDRMEAYGRIGTLYARGTSNAAALIALVEGGVFEALPDLRVVVTALAFGGLASLAQFAAMTRQDGGAEAMTRTLRRHVFIDTMGFHAPLLRACVDLVGADNVVAGSDWPIVDEGPISARLAQAMQAAGLTPHEQQAVARVNALRLLGLDTRT